MMAGAFRDGGPGIMAAAGSSCRFFSRLRRRGGRGRWARCEPGPRPRAGRRSGGGAIPGRAASTDAGGVSRQCGRAPGGLRAAATARRTLSGVPGSVKGVLVHLTASKGSVSGAACHGVVRRVRRDWTGLRSRRSRSGRRQASLMPHTLSASPRGRLAAGPEVRRGGSLTIVPIMSTRRDRSGIGAARPATTS